MASTQAVLTRENILEKILARLIGLHHPVYICVQTVEGDRGIRNAGTGLILGHASYASERRLRSGRCSGQETDHNDCSRHQAVLRSARFLKRLAMSSRDVTLLPAYIVTNPANLQLQNQE